MEEKISTIAKKIYGADGIELSDEAKLKIERYTQQVSSIMLYHLEHLIKSSKYRTVSKKDRNNEVNSIILYYYIFRDFQSYLYAWLKPIYRYQRTLS